MPSPDFKERILYCAEPLKCEDFLLIQNGYREILTPKNIPIHPAVHSSDFTYTEEFIKAVLQKVPERIRKDVSVIGESFRLKPVYVCSTELTCGTEVFNLKDFRLSFETSKITISNSSSILSLSKENNEWIEEEELQDHPMRKNLIKDYFTETIAGKRAPSWSIENYLEQPFVAQLSMRNIAITANNLGLEWLARGKIS